MLEDRPSLTPADAEALAEHHYGVVGVATELVSDRDQNFMIDSSAGRSVLKIANRREDPSVLEFQRALMVRLQTLDYDTPSVQTTTSGGFTASTADGHLVRMLDWVSGVPCTALRPATSAQRRQIGTLAGAIAECLDGFEHPAAERSLTWDLARAEHTVADRLCSIETAGRRDLLGQILARHAEWCGPRLAELRRGVIHNDLNDHNLLFGNIELRDGWPHRSLVGVIDVGDALQSWIVGDLAVAIAYAVLGCEDVLTAAGEVASGFQPAFELRDAEVECVFELAALRLALSVVIAAEQSAQEPDNDYLRVSQSPAWKALERISRIQPGLAACHLRAACGRPASAAGAALARWIERTDTKFAPVVNRPLRGDDVHVFDLGVGSTEMGNGAPGTFETNQLSAALFGRMRDAGAAVGLGRYDEVRSWYGGELFAAPGNAAPRRRTLHIGVDVFAAPGTPVHAPLAGTVVSSTINTGRLDYGPTLILEHDPPDGPRFWSLYGHLTADTMNHTPVGSTIAGGDVIGAMGDFPINGDWAPHLHFQLIADRLDYQDDFPGVCAPEDRPVWTGLSPDPGHILGMDPAQVAPVGRPGIELAELRARHLAPSLSLSYRRPLTIVRGFRQYLYDEAGQPFLDAVNNVPHVGHSHPHVVAAAAAQNAVLNTNTRYLHANVLDYAERLTATLPEPLEVCFFVCSGSEANELALRIARAVTDRGDVIALQGAYHGNTSSLIDVSSYKHAGPGGNGAPPWVHVAAMPDPYRGEFQGADAGSRYAEEVRRCCVEATSRGGAAAFLVEPLLGCGGQIVPPAGYLRAAFAHVRAAGGLCIADEVQIGFGRVGSHFWAFEAQGVVPDIVTLGKPIGNGYPLAAVITTRVIADAFANGMEYFNTFGGNPVAAAVGSAVLDVIEEERLQANARTVGGQLLTGLRELAARSPLIGDVRGVGLYLGAELVRDRESREPAGPEAGYVADRMRDLGVLISTDGPHHNVLKIKPPLCFTAHDAEFLIDRLGRVLGDDVLQPGAWPGVGRAATGKDS